MSRASRFFLNGWRTVNLVAFGVGLAGPWTRILARGTIEQVEASGLAIFAYLPEAPFASFRFESFCFLFGLLGLLAYFVVSIWTIVRARGNQPRCWLLTLAYGSIGAIALAFLLRPDEMQYWLWGFWLTYAALLSGCILETVLLRLNRAPF